MKTSLNIRDDLLIAAMRVSGVKEKTAVIHLGLEELIRKAARERLINLAGTARRAKVARRRRA